MGPRTVTTVVTGTFEGAACCWASIGRAARRREANRSELASNLKSLVMSAPSDKEMPKMGEGVYGTLQRERRHGAPAVPKKAPRGEFDASGSMG